LTHDNIGEVRLGRLVVLYIATVHYASPRWIEIQTRYIREHVSVPYQTWSSLEGIDPSYAVHFDRIVEQTGRHAEKLNHLAIEISHEAAAEDLLMFLDGDAFPIADPMPLIHDSLTNAPVMAVRRAENLDDPQPHPCFCVTTVGAWRELPGDWSAGYEWLNSQGENVSDVGGNLLRQLELTKTPWVEVLRSNHHDIDPIFYAVYGGVVYHHGAGFRTMQFTRARNAIAPESRPLPRSPFRRRLVRRDNWKKQQTWKREVQEHGVRQSEQIRQTIERGDAHWLAELT
jgi:hypothetical protein